MVIHQRVILAGTILRQATQVATATPLDIMDPEALSISARSFIASVQKSERVTFLKFSTSTNRVCVLEIFQSIRFVLIAIFYK